jgi:hypothetical protein
LTVAFDRVQRFGLSYLQQALQTFEKLVAFYIVLFFICFLTLSFLSCSAALQAISKLTVSYAYMGDYDILNTEQSVPANGWTDDAVFRMQAKRSSVGDLPVTKGDFHIYAGAANTDTLSQKGGAVMLDGLWVGEWHSNINNIRVGTGVIIFHQGKFYGGNDRFYYIGDFKLDGNRIDGNLQFTYYSGEPLSIFGLEDIDQSNEMLISGFVSGDEIQLEGTLKRNRRVMMKGILHKKAGGEIF